MARDYSTVTKVIQHRTLAGRNGPVSDAELVARVCAGDSEALGELFLRHAPMVRRLLTRIIGPRDDLDDVVQDVFLQVHKSIGGFRGEARFTTWLHQLTVYAGYNYLRRPRGRYVLVEPADLERVGDPRSVGEPERLMGQETLRRLYIVLDRIKPKKRIAFILYAVEGMSVAEVAKVVGASVPTVKSRIWFARRELLKKARLDPYLASLLEELGCDESST